jgi:O-antigen ligase
MPATDRQGWFFPALVTCLSGLAVGLVYSPALLSLSSIAGIATALLFGNYRLRDLPRYLRHPTVAALIALYVIVLLSLWQTEDWTYYVERLRIKLPLLVLPLAWIGVEPALGDGRIRRYGRLCLLLLLSVTLAGVLTDYVLHFAEYNQALELGQPIPVPRGNHVRFSLFLALGSVTGLHGWYRYGKRAEGYLAAFLFVGVHLLAVRTGLVAAYGGLTVYLLTVALRGKQYPLILAVGVAVLTLPAVAYLAVPTLRTKIDYTLHEWRFRNTDDPRSMLEYSDASRLTSIRIGIDVWRKQPLFGVGYGNLNRAMATAYADRLPGVASLRPHNQFVSALVAGGVVGLVWTVGCFVLLGWGGGRWRQPHYLAVFTVLLLSCLVENTLESSVGVTLFTLSFLLAGQPFSRKPG